MIHQCCSVESLGLNDLFAGLMSSEIKAPISFIHPYLVVNTSQYCIYHPLLINVSGSLPVFFNKNHIKR